MGFRADFGFSGLCEPEELLLLSQLMLSEGRLVSRAVSSKCAMQRAAEV